MLKEILSVFRPARSQQLRAFFIGQSVSIGSDYYHNANTTSFDIPIHGWTIKNISDNSITIIRNGAGKNKRILIDCKYLNNELVH